nr:MAG TPA: hypothetical protein [Caudoviricetes sp.]
MCILTHLLYCTIFPASVRWSLPRLSQALYYRLVLQRRQCPLPGLVVQFLQPGLQLRVQLYPAVQLCRCAAGRGVEEVGLCQVTHVDCVHSALQIKN